ncbi:DUF3347 domain-containing protein [Pedobacter cryoconitis]|uniref:Cu(I)/Ag(I) efflux system membrane fusion protein n=1 Tax=Pedobacter cryoconitis TaxID=188932 RepID=A0A327SI62_9SPHI|nr:DUF3347 domain-containing protein [Pedobacter cryoconitis]RAJ28152.1 Cu(I)/Ag(I) efflux system membrane fusion protein [Pedobacter cryoconitis]
MKRIFYMIALIGVIFVHPVSAQQNTDQSTALLSSYYSIKDALVTDNAKLTASKAAEFVKILTKGDLKTIDAAQQKVLTADAGKIAASNALNSQRDYFAALSAHMISTAKTSKLSADPIYELYCPMKKSSWLSSTQAIRNPYYGSTMLSCGKVTETIK